LTRLRASTVHSGNRLWARIASRAFQPTTTSESPLRTAFQSDRAHDSAEVETPGMVSERANQVYSALRSPLNSAWVWPPVRIVPG